MASCAQSSASWSTAGPSPPSAPARARAARAIRASRSLLQRRDAVEHGADRRGVERRAAGRQPSLFDADDLELSGFRRRASRLVEEPPDVVEDFAPVGGVGWQAVHHDDERKPALADPAKHVPRHAVGIARRGRDEDAEVGGLDQPVGDDPVGVLDRIDVRRIDDCKAGGGGRVADELDLAGVEPRQRTLGEGGAILRVREDDRRPCRRPKDTGRAQRATGDRVEERALAGPGRAQQQNQRAAPRDSGHGRGGGR